MEMKFYATPKEFLEDNRAFLREHEAAAQLNYGNAKGHENDPCRPDLLFGRCEQDGRGVLLFGNTLPWNLCLNAIPGDPAALSAAVLLAEHLREREVPLRGVTARDDLNRAFRSAYCGTWKLRTAMDVMVLKEVAQPPAAPGRARHAVMDDLGTLTDWDAAFHREAVSEEVDPARRRKSIAALIEGGAAHVWENGEGELVSAAYNNRSLPHGAGISGVYTPPEHRSRGYCQNNVAALCAELLAAGNDYCTLFVNRQNPVSNRAYGKIGFRISENCYEYTLQEG